MNVTDVAELIAAGLATAGLEAVPILEPGTPISSLPAVVLAPNRDRLGPGNRVLVHGLDVTVMVPRNDQVPQYARLQTITAEVVRALLPSAVQFDGDIEFTVTGGRDTGEPAAMNRTIPVTFTGDTDLCRMELANARIHDQSEQLGLDQNGVDHDYAVS